MVEYLKPGWVEINLANITHNIKEIRKIISPKTKIMSVVKRNAYGHGLVEVAKTVVDAGAEMLGVARLEEVIRLRQAGVLTPILILRAIESKEDAEGVLEYKATPTVFTSEGAKLLSMVGARHHLRLKVHIKIDTGMGRLGVDWEDAVGLIQQISALEGIEIEGIFSHLAAGDEPDKTYAEEQFRKFEDICGQLARAGINIPIRHISNSAAVLDLPRMNLEIVRPGISVYGLFPSKTVSRRADLRPAMSFKTTVVYLKKLRGQRDISYGSTYQARQDSIIATLPIGYNEGYSRLLGNRAEVLVRGKRAKVVGRVTMDNVMIDVTHIPGVEVGDEVVLFGSQGNEIISVDEIADLMGTINYEVTCLVGGTNPHLYLK